MLQSLKPLPVNTLLLDATNDSFHVLLGDVALTFNSVEKGMGFKSALNAIYFPKFNNGEITNNVHDTLGKEHVYLQIECDSNLADARYLLSFFKSKLGRLILDSLYLDGTGFLISKNKLITTQISIPTLQLQKQIVSTIDKIELIKNNITLFESNISINPISSHSTLKKLDDMLEIIDELADSDKVKMLIRNGESKSIEFKETFSLDIKTQTKEKHIENSAIKTVAAFLNTDGGTLLIGVTDSGVIKGVDDEVDKFHKSFDKFLLHFKNILKTRIGEEYYPFINQRLVEVDNLFLLVVECSRSTNEVFVDEKDFYVRTNLATDKLEGRTMAEYIKNRFNR